MTQKLPQDVSPEMRDRLQTNRTGKLTSNQWIDIVTQPLVSLLVLFAPLMAIFLPRMLLVLARGWAILLFVVVVLAIMTAVRAVRYARVPVYFGLMEARDPAPPFWMFWRRFTLVSETGSEVHFSRRLTPPFRVQRGKKYLVYYFKDEGSHVLLSLAPARHPESDHWQPDQAFTLRLQQRSSGRMQPRPPAVSSNGTQPPGAD